ncbi:MAG: cobalamin B12-binding domain-containing protein, partial [Planctomycetota bacterium]
MEEKHLFAANILRGGIRAFAGFAASEVISACAEAKEKLGPDPFAAWRDFLAARVEELAAAIAAGRPAVFAAQVRWAAELLQARGLPAGFVRTSIEKLRSVLAAELPPEARETATAFVDRALADFASGSEPPPERLAPTTPYRALAASYLVALLEGDRKRARDLVLERARAGTPAAELYLEVLAPAEEEIGRMWQANEITVAEEHFATATTEMVAAQVAALAPERPSNGKTVLAAAAPGNRHDLGLRMLAHLFEIEGWRTIYLGADAPIPDLLDAIASFRPDLLALSAALAVQVPAVKAA